MERSQRIIVSHLVIIRCTFPKYQHWEWTPAHVLIHNQEQRKQSITNIININCVLNTLSSFWRVFTLVLLISYSKPSKKQILWSPFYREGKWKQKLILLHYCARYDTKEYAFCIYPQLIRNNFSQSFSEGLVGGMGKTGYWASFLKENYKVHTTPAKVAERIFWFSYCLYLHDAA